LLCITDKAARTGAKLSEFTDAISKDPVNGFKGVLLWKVLEVLFPPLTRKKAKFLHGHLDTYEEEC